VVSSVISRRRSATLSSSVVLRKFLIAPGMVALGSAVHAQTATAHYSGAQSSVAVSATINSIGGIGVDAAGNVYLSDLDGEQVVKETLSSDFYTESTIPVSGGVGINGLAVDAAGNIYTRRPMPVGSPKKRCQVVCIARAPCVLQKHGRSRS
jgi:hypothetical protein